MNIGHDDERVAFEVTAANAHHPYQYTRVHTHIYIYIQNQYSRNFFKFFSKKKKEKIITKIIKRSKLSKDAKNIFFSPPLSLSLIHVTTQFRGKKEGEEGKKGKIIRWLRILNEKTRDKEADNR